MMRNVVRYGDVRECLKGVDGVIQCCVTSPPYWMLRDYRVEGQLGLEKTPGEYVANMVEVFRLVRTALRDDGLLWVNLGDTYRDSSQGIPWKVALAMQEDGWYLRSDIIWHKPDIMPQSIVNRVTIDHEYIFMFSKHKRYYYDQEAVKVEGKFVTGRVNLRSVWSLAKSHDDTGHIAPFPETIPERCIKASTSEKGACRQCGAPWKRIVKRTASSTKATEGKYLEVWGKIAGSVKSRPGRFYDHTTETLGWEPTCGCGCDEVVPCIVMDPFAGSGTTLRVAKDLRRDYFGIELDSKNALRMEASLKAAEDREEDRQCFDAMMTREVKYI